MSKQTAVEWFYNQLIKNKIIQIGSSTYEDKVLTKHEILFQQAKEMEKGQIMNAHEFGAINWQGGIDNFIFFQENSHYYNETYGGNK